MQRFLWAALGAAAPLWATAFAFALEGATLTLTAAVGEVVSLAEDYYECRRLLTETDVESREADSLGVAFSSLVTDLSVPREPNMDDYRRAFWNDPVLQLMYFADADAYIAFLREALAECGLSAWFPPTNERLLEIRDCIDEEYFQFYNAAATEGARLYQELQELCPDAPGGQQIQAPPPEPLEAPGEEAAYSDSSLSLEPIMTVDRISSDTSSAFTPWDEEAVSFDTAAW